MINKIKELITKYRELITYVIAGMLTTLVNWATYTLFVRFILNSIRTAELKATVSSAIAWVAGVIFAYIINKLWVFESKSMAPAVVAKEFTSFVASRAVTGVMEVFGLPLLMKIGLDQTIFGVEGALAKVIISIVVIILNYVFSKLVIFKKPKNTEETE